MGMAMIGFKAPETARQFLEGRAKAEQVTISEYIRKLVVREATRQVLDPQERSGETEQ
jgi:hypothetical protein